MKSSRVMFFLIALLLTINLSAQDGTLDTSFGVNGLVEVSDAKSLITQHKSLPNNKSILLTKYGKLVKINEDGSLDNSFGENGSVNLIELFVASDSTFFYFNDFDLTKDGKIVVGGVTSINSNNNVDGAYLTVIQLDANGSLNTEFGDNGITERKIVLRSNLGIMLDGSGKIKVLPNDKIVVSIVDTAFGSDYSASVRRLNENGTFDNSFGIDGFYRHLPRTYGRIKLNADYDGNIYLVDDIFIDKVLDSGIADTSFGNNGTFSINKLIRDIDFQSDGKIIATLRYYDYPTSTFKPLIVRINKNGELDSSFAVNGLRDVERFISSNNDVFENTVVMPDDDIISGGYSYDDTQHYNVILSKLTNNGNFVESFGDSGKVLIDFFGDSEERACGLVVNSDNYDITVSAISEKPDSSQSIVLGRFLNTRTYQDIHVSGDVSGVWHPGTIFVDGDITVPQNQSLTIKPGANVYFTGEYTFDIYGQLIAKGAENDSIFFFSDSLGRDYTNPYRNYKGHWFGLGFKNTDENGSPNSEISYCGFKYAVSKGWETYWEPWMDMDLDSLGAPIRLYYSSNVNLNNLTISECNSDVFANIQMVHSSPEISEITFKDTWSAMHFRKSSNAKVHDLDLESARIYIIDSSPEFENLYVHDTYGVSLIGENFDGKVTNSIFKNNLYTYTNGGGALKLIDDSSPIFEHVIFEGNKSTYNGSWYGVGGVGFIRDSSPEFTNCEFINNMSVGEGSVFYIGSNDYSNPWITTINNCLFVKNKSTNGSGTILTGTNTRIEMINSTLAHNSAPFAAAINNDSGVPNIITNSIIYGNGPNFEQQFTTHQTQHVLAYNIIQGNYYGIESNTTNLLDVDPLFRDTSTNDYHLQSVDCGYSANSPAIDAGDPEIGDLLLDCSTAGLGLRRSDIGAYGGADNWWDKTILPTCHYSGEVSGVWDCEVIYIDGDIVIPYGDTLKITEAVDWVSITGPYQIKVEGVLLAQGPKDAIATLNGEQLNFQGTDWKGILFNNLNDTNPGTSIIENCRFDYADKMDMAYQDGGAIAIYNSDNVIVRGSVFYLNQAKLGGAIYIEKSNAHIENCYFNLNGRERGQNGVASATSGGAMYVKNSNPFMHKLFFIDNHSINGGGAVVLDNSSPTITNIMMVRNFTAGFGGAMRLVNGASPNIVNMSSSNNVAETAAGTFYLSTDSNPTIINSIMYGNTKPEINLNGGTPVVTYSIVDSGATETYFGEGCLEDNPYFVAGVEYLLANNNCSYSEGSSVVSTAIDASHPDSLDSELDCRGGLGTSRADMGYYGGRYSDMPVGVEEVVKTQIPIKYQLEQNYPNPFNPSTTIQFAIPKAGVVSLKIYNILGEEVTELINREMNAGYQSVNFDASNLSSGLYFYRISVGNFVNVKKMLLLK